MTNFELRKLAVLFSETFAELMVVENKIGLQGLCTKVSTLISDLWHLAECLRSWSTIP